MSRRKYTHFENTDFVQRLIEVCETSKPAKMAKVLEVSYQAAKNYLQGRLPDTNVLMTISQKTNYSLDWLITGEGKKFTEKARKMDGEIFTDELKAFVRHECLEVINEFFGKPNESSNPKIVVVSPDKIMQEKVIDQPVPVPMKSS